MDQEITLTNYDTGEKMNIKESDITAYRGETGYTTMYLDNGEIIRVKESFKRIDKLITENGGED